MRSASPKAECAVRSFIPLRWARNPIGAVGGPLPPIARQARFGIRTNGLFRFNLGRQVGTPPGYGRASAEPTTAMWK